MRCQIFSSEFSNKRKRKDGASEGNRLNKCRKKSAEKSISDLPEEIIKIIIKNLESTKDLKALSTIKIFHNQMPEIMLEFWRRSANQLANFIADDVEHEKYINILKKHNGGDLLDISFCRSSLDERAIIENTIPLKNLINGQIKRLGENHWLTVCREIVSSYFLSPLLRRLSLDPLPDELILELSEYFKVRSVPMDQLIRLLFMSAEQRSSNMPELYSTVMLNIIMHLSFGYFQGISFEFSMEMIKQYYPTLSEDDKGYAIYMLVNHIVDNKQASDNQTALKILKIELEEPFTPYGGMDISFVYKELQGSYPNEMADYVSNELMGLQC